MVRENAGYALDDGELPVLRRAASEFAAAGVDGIVVGFARAGAPAIDDSRACSRRPPACGRPSTAPSTSSTIRSRAIDSLTAIAQIDRI